MEQKKKIGIITLSASDNCGSLLQCYALKKLLEPYGDVEVINFSSKSSHKIYDIPKLNLKYFLRLIRKPKERKRYLRLLNSKKAYNSFRTKHLNIKGKEIFPEELYKIKDKYDIFVAGSDQIWNVRMVDFDEAFFLGWTNKKKVAYAPSLGESDIRVSDNYKQIIKWINDFKYLSVREEIGKKCLDEISNSNALKLPDPTLVLEEKSWKSLVGEPLIKGEYIFYYSWAYCEDCQLNLVKKEAERLKLPVIVIDARKWADKDEKYYGFTLSKHEGPLAYLNLMYYAKQVYVESFHGMVFAYIFKKNFYLLDTNKDLNELDKRLKDFVNLLKTQDRIMTIYNYKNIDFNKNFEYSTNETLEKLKIKAKEYIKNSMA